MHIVHWYLYCGSYWNWLQLSLWHQFYSVHKLSYQWHMSCFVGSNKMWCVTPSHHVNWCLMWWVCVRANRPTGMESQSRWLWSSKCSIFHLSSRGKWIYFAFYPTSSCILLHNEDLLACHFRFGGKNSGWLKATLSRFNIFTFNSRLQDSSAVLWHAGTGTETANRLSG